MTTKGAERRRHQRIDAVVEVSVTSENNFFTGFTHDISEGGVFVATGDPLPIGTTVEFELTLAPGRGKVPFRGTVAWVRERNPYTESVPPGMGIQFGTMHPQVRSIINAFIAQRRESLFFDAD